jgi:uncharacterized glyoxalase superfamily protein PhnB
MIGAPKRAGFHTVTPYIVVADLARFSSFVVDGLDGEETFRTEGEGGGVHVEYQIGDSRIMVGESAQGAMPAMLFLYVEDAEALITQAERNGAKIVMPLEAGRFGEVRGGALEDPSGNSWFVAEHGAGSESP